MAYDDGWESAMEAAGRGRLERVSPMLGGLPHPQHRMLTDTAAWQHGRCGTAAARLIIRGRLGLDEGRGEGEGGLRAWPELARVMMIMMVMVMMVRNMFVGRNYQDRVAYLCG